MRACLSLEAIGEDAIGHLRLGRVRCNAAIPGSADAIIGSVAEWQRWGVWTVDDRDNPIREVYGHKDYSRANRMGSRGVTVSYMLEPGRYMVKSPVSWRKTDMYICAVTDDGRIVRERSI